MGIFLENKLSTQKLRVRQKEMSYLYEKIMFCLIMYEAKSKW